VRIGYKFILLSICIQATAYIVSLILLYKSSIRTENYNMIDESGRAVVIHSAFAASRKIISPSRSTIDHGLIEKNSIMTISVGIVGSAISGKSWYDVSARKEIKSNKLLHAFDMRLPYGLSLIVAIDFFAVTSLAVLLFCVYRFLRSRYCQSINKCVSCGYSLVSIQNACPECGCELPLSKDGAGNGDISRAGGDDHEVSI
jgi:hypothetical protein